MQACPWAGAHSSQKYCTAEIQNYKTLSMLNTGNEGTFFFFCCQTVQSPYKGVSVISDESTTTDLTDRQHTDLHQKR